LVIYENGLSSYILLQKGVKIDTMIYAGSFLNSGKVNKGDSVLLKYIPLFSIVSNMENKPYKGSSLCRAAGVGAILIGKKKRKRYFKIKFRMTVRTFVGMYSKFRCNIKKMKW